MAKWAYRLTIDGKSETVPTTARNRNGAMAKGKDGLRDKRMGTWQILGFASKPGHLELENEKTHVRAVIDAVEE